MTYSARTNKAKTMWAKSLAMVMVFASAVAAHSHEDHGHEGHGAHAQVASGATLRVVDAELMHYPEVLPFDRYELAFLRAKVEREQATIQYQASLVSGSQTQDPKTQDAKGADPANKEQEKKRKLTPEEQLAADVAKDKAMGKEYSDYYDKKYPASRNTAAYDKIRQIGEELALIANSNPTQTTWGDRRHAQFEYKFKLVQDKDINAFSLPGGYIYVFEGLVDFAQSDDEIAAVLAHEICHASQRHVATLESESNKASNLTIPFVLAAVLTGGTAGLAAGAITGAMATQGMMSGWSQRAEESADFGGFQIIEMSRFNPTGMLTFMERLRMRETVNFDPGIFRTHPPSKFRAEKIDGFMRKSGIPIKRSLVTTQFRASWRELEDGAVAVFFGPRKLFTFAPGPEAVGRGTDTVRLLNDFYDSVPEMFEITTGSGGVIYGKNRVVVQLSDSDAAYAKVPIDRLQTLVSNNMRRSAESLGYHVWERNTFGQ